MSAQSETATFAAGCFWGVEVDFRNTPGVTDVQVGYSGGHVEDPSYEQVCRGRTGHAEAVEVTFDPDEVSYADLVDRFWSVHDPTQVNRQGWDVGTQYRSAIYTDGDEQQAAAEASRDAYAVALAKAGRGEITTEIQLAGPFYYAEDYHQQYLSKNPNGYCGLGGTGVACPVGLGVRQPG